MPRRPEIGSVQLYPNRPLKKSDKNGYVLKFYCPLRKKRIRRNCGTRDRREARKILRECRERLLNGDYERSGGAITAQHVMSIPISNPADASSHEKSWQECFEKYRRHCRSRIRRKSLDDTISKINIAERIFEKHFKDCELPEGLPVRRVMTLEMLEYLQDRLLQGDECRYDNRSPNSVNSVTGSLMVFVRFCCDRGWIDSVPRLRRIKTDEVMKGRPITTEEFERMLEATPEVVGKSSADSWQFALQVLWESGFRIGDLMDFHWTDENHIHPVWPKRKSQHPTIIIPSTQKNGRVQEIPMLPGLQELLKAVPKSQQTGWVVNPLPVESTAGGKFRPSEADLSHWIQSFSNRSIAAACGVTDTAVRKWLVEHGIRRELEFQSSTSAIPLREIERVRNRSKPFCSRSVKRSIGRLTTERVGRIIGMIGKDAGILVKRDDEIKRVKFASAHDLRRGCALRLINAGVSSETLKVVMRHKDFATTEKHYGAYRSAQAAAIEIVHKLADNGMAPLVGGFMGGTDITPQLNTEELLKLKCFLNSL